MILRIDIANFEFETDYFTKLLGCIHKWIGSDNEIHGTTSLICYSNIYRNHFYFSSFSDSVCIRLLYGIKQEPKMWGNVFVTSVKKIEWQQNGHYFRTMSPIFCKKDGRHLFNEEAEEQCKAILLHKAEIAGIKLEDFDIRLKLEKHKLVKIHDISNRCAHYEVYISDERAANFAMCVGLGNCTGTGFGFILPNL